MAMLIIIVLTEESVETQRIEELTSKGKKRRRIMQISETIQKIMLLDFYHSSVRLFYSRVSCTPFSNVFIMWHSDSITSGLHERKHIQQDLKNRKAGSKLQFVPHGSIEESIYLTVILPLFPVFTLLSILRMYVPFQYS